LCAASQAGGADDRVAGRALDFRPANVSVWRERWNAKSFPREVLVEFTQLLNPLWRTSAMNTKILAILFALVSASPLAVRAQAPSATAPAKPDSAQVRADIEKAKRDAGAEWAGEEHFFCEDPHANRADDPVIEPAKIFDNVYATGRTSTVEYEVVTRDGIVLLDSGYADDVEAVLLPGMKALGLDPAKIKDVIVMHGHVDHFGGSAYLQEHFGAHVYVSAPDWDLIEHPPAANAGAPQPPHPGRDQVTVEGQPIVLGEEKFVPVAVPGHTPGSVGVIFPVTDHGKTYMAALYGGLILTPNRISDEGLQQYLKSVAHFGEETKKAHVEVELENHAMMDAMPDKLAKLKNRTAGEPHPFVVGQSGYQKFLEVMADCTQVEVDRRKE
jgi:metallo-beta-lactamase class B